MFTQRLILAVHRTEICSFKADCSLLAGGLWVFLSWKNPGKREVSDRRRHLANVLSSEFYCSTETFQLRYLVRNYAFQRAN